MRKKHLWDIFDRWDGRTLKPDGRVHLHTLDDAMERVEGFARDLESNVPITLENDGTCRFFGNGEEIVRWKGNTPYSLYSPLSSSVRVTQTHLKGKWR